MLSVYIQNDSSGSEKIGNYTYVVAVNRNVIHRGALKGHRRSKGWAALLKMVAKDGQQDMDSHRRLEK